tara:strand:+ start:2481 stop:3125 length:645 start_codon:yes stop_codon:yes gene_type:complete
MVETKKDFRKKFEMGIYMNSLLTRKITVAFKFVGQNIKQTIESAISKDIEGKCSVEGYIKPKSTKVITYSSGILVENDIVFDVVFECLICCPVEGMIINCVAKNITQAGIRAVFDNNTNNLVDGSVENDNDNIITNINENSPFVAYISRDHHYNSKNFSKVKDRDSIRIRVIGQRYELNDKYISIIGELLDQNYEEKQKMGTKAKRVLEKIVIE